MSSSPFVFYKLFSIEKAYIIPPIILGSIAGAGATGSGLLATSASVVKQEHTTDAILYKAETHFNWINDTLIYHVNTNSPVAALNPTKLSIFHKLDNTIDLKSPTL